MTIIWMSSVCADVESSVPYIYIGGHYTRDWDKEMYRDRFEEISPQQVEAYCSAILEDRPDHGRRDGQSD